MQVSTVVSRGKVGDEISIVVKTVHPREDILSMSEVIKDTE
jgi:exoribonuclease II